MKIYAKLGTLPGSHYHVCNKRNNPKVGERINIKEENKRFFKKIGAYVHDIRHVHGEDLYILERM